MWRGALTLLQSQAASTGVTSGVPGFVGTLLDQAIAAGHAKNHIGAVVEVIGKRRE
jgi:hypothetical protein